MRPPFETRLQVGNQLAMGMEQGFHGKLFLSLFLFHACEYETSVESAKTLEC
jgi:hypothetical protein